MVARRACTLLLPPRSMVGQPPLERHIGVRIPGGQPQQSSTCTIVVLGFPADVRDVHPIQFERTSLTSVAPLTCDSFGQDASIWVGRFSSRRAQEHPQAGCSFRPSAALLGLQRTGTASQTGLPATGYTEVWCFEQFDQPEQPSRKAGYPTRSTNS